MIITLIGANFKDSNIGTLSTWSISRVLGDGATYSGDTYVDKNAALNATVTIAEGYELGSAGVTVTMGGETQSGVATVSEDGKTITITIGSVTGNVVIKVPTKNVNTGEEDGGEVETPTVTTWYVDHRNNASSFSSSVNIAGRGWCHVPATPAYEAYVGKPVNAIGFFTNSTSQTVTIMKVPEKGGVDEGTIIATTTATGSGSKEFVYVTFPTVTLAEGECLAAFAQDDSNINFYYASSTGVTDANGIVDGNFYGRVPKVYGSGTAWTNYTEKLCLGWSIGYVV